jgi:competence protein ComEC
MKSVLGSQSFWEWLGVVGGGLVLYAGMEMWARLRLVTLAPLGRFLAVVLVVLGIGGARHVSYQMPSPRALAPIATAADEPVSLRGVVTSAPERTKTDTRFVLTVDTVFGTSDTMAVDGRTRVTLRPSPWADDVGPFPAIEEGDVVQLQGALRRPPGLRNPGGFDYRAYLARRGICCTAYVSTPSQITVRGRQQTWVTSTVVAVRAHVRRQIARYVPSDGGRAILRALLLGDRSRVTDTQRERFAKTGLMHLLAVSGLHVFLVGMMLYLLLRPLLMRFRLPWHAVEITRAVCTVLLLGFYMLLTGGRPSVMRAVLMASLFIGAILLQRSAHPLNTLGVAALVLLGLRPTALFDVGFQLSMTAVAAIVTLDPVLRGFLPDHDRDGEVLQWTVQTITTSAAAILGTAPILLYHFGWVSVAGLLLNVVGIPCTGVGLSAALAMVVMGGISSVAGAAFGTAADLFIRGLLATSRYGAAWFSWAGLRMATPNPWILGALVAALIALAQWPRPRNRWRWSIAALLLTVGAVWSGTVGPRAEPTLDVLFFDVGQGDAALVTTPTNRRILVDTGPWSPDGGAAEYVLVPYLKRSGIQHLDAVVVTHPDEDHLGGLPTLLREVSVGRVIHNGRSADTELYEKSRRLMTQTETPHRTVHRGDTLRLGPAVRAQVLGPPDDSTGQPSDRNNASVVLHLQYGDVDVLFPGDVESSAEQSLVRTYGHQLESRVTTVPHHGSPTSSIPAFVQAVASEGGHAVVSVGRENQYGMPAPNVLSRWRSQRVDLHTTAQSGAVWMQTDGEAVWQQKWR